LPGSTSSTAESQATLLAVDLGLRSGLAVYCNDGRLLWYRSTNFGSIRRLKQAVPGILDGIDNLQAVVLEGGGQLAEPWQRECQRRSLACQVVAAETWRSRILIPRRQLGAQLAKQNAGELARAVIECLAVRRPTSLRHDAAEAVLVGLDALIRFGWHDAARLAPIRQQFPSELCQRLAAPG
jgi:hypothetical protein